MISGYASALIVAFALAMVPPDRAMAQGGSSMAVNIISGLSVLTDRGTLSFGDILPNTNASVTVSATSTSSAKYRIRGQQNKNTIITVTTDRTLESSGNALYYTPAASYANTDAPGTATAFPAFTAGTATTWQSQVTLKLANNLPGNEGQLWLWLHGTLDDTDGVPPGTYTGAATTSAVYQ
ncbi:MAG TPA: hypothetical protein VMK65_10955 [Longimicrobiales bacterium]|nr:hypothetical protein [Longimicrobiales bacterium]